MNDEEREALAAAWPDFWQVHAVVERIIAQRSATAIVAAVEKVLDEMVQYDSTQTMPNVRHQEHVRWAERIHVALRQPVEMPGGLLPDLRHLAVGGPDLPPEVFSQPLADTARLPDHEAQIRDLLEEREELLTEIRRLRMGNHPAGRALPHLALAEALTERDAEHEGGEDA